MNNSRLNTHPCGTPVSRTKVSEVLFSIYTVILMKIGVGPFKKFDNKMSLTFNYETVILSDTAVLLSYLEH